MSTVSTPQQIADALKIYADKMRDYIIGKLKQNYRSDRDWFEAYLNELGYQQKSNAIRTMEQRKEAGEEVNPEDVFDIVHVKNLLLGHRDIFQDDFGRSYQRVVTWSDEILDVRHKQAHQQDIAPNDLTRTMDSIVRILQAIGAEEEAAQLSDTVRTVVAPVRNTNNVSLQPWWRAAEPHRDIRKGRFDESTFAAKLGDVVAGSAPSEYQRAGEFFKKTYLTRELRGLLIDTLKRLAGEGGEAVVQLRTPFGGGKTHTLIGLYHLIDSAADIEDEAGIRELLDDAGLEHIPHARVAVVVGTELDVNPHEVEPGVTVRTVWGHIAYQLGGKEGYELLRTDDESRISPSGATLRKLFETYKRVLILLDEILVYQVRASAVKVEDSNLQAQTFAFLQTLTEAVGSSPGTAFVTTFPESHIEYYDHENADVVFNTLGKIFGRVEATRVPVQGEEIFEVVRRRLFESINDDSAKSTVAAYQQAYDTHQDDLPDHVRSTNYARRMQRAYPFHPELIDVLYERWGTLQTFQKTRGVLRLLARVVEYGYMSPSARPLIGIGDVGLDDPDLRATVVTILRGSNWDPVLASDVIPEDGKAYLLDKERGDQYAKQKLCETITKAVFMYSHSGGGERGVQKARLTFALTQPEGINPTLISDALSRLSDRLYYFYGGGTQSYVFKVQANLNAVLSDRIAHIKPDQVSETLQKAVESRAAGGLFKPFVWPTESREVPDNTQLKLVLLPPDAHTDDEDELDRLRYLIQNHASGPRINKNKLVQLAGRPEDFERARGVARELLALEDIEQDRGLELSDDQKKDLKSRLASLRDTLPETAKAIYTMLYDAEDTAGKTYRIYDLSARVKTSRTIGAAVTDHLKDEDRLLDALDPALISGDHYKIWPSDKDVLGLRDLRDYFDRFPYLPYLESSDVLLDAIIRGVKNGLFEVALKNNDDYSQVWRQKNPPEAKDLHFADHYLLTKVGFVPKPAPTPSGTEDHEGGTGGTGSDGGKSTPPDKGSDDDGGTIEPKPKQTTTNVRLRFRNLPLDKVANIVDIANALEDAKGEVSLDVTVSAHNPKGLDRAILEMSVQELISQHGLEVMWEEE